MAGINTGMIKRKDHLRSPVFLLGLALLLANDFFFKAYFHNSITGKLSDIAGLFIFPLFISVILRSDSKLIFWAIAAFFIYWKSPLSNSLLEMLSSVSGQRFERVVDYTDLFCLPVLIVSYRYMIGDHRQVHFPRIIILLCSAFAFMATSRTKEAYMKEQELIGSEYQSLIPQGTHIIRLERLNTVITYTDTVLELEYARDTMIVSFRARANEIYPPVFLLKNLKNGNIQLTKIFIHKQAERDEQKWFNLLNTEISRRHLLLKRKREK